MESRECRRTGSAGERGVQKNEKCGRTPHTVPDHIEGTFEGNGECGRTGSRECRRTGNAG